MSETVVGICGNHAEPLIRSSPPLICDLPAGHAGWHSSLVPGSIMEQPLRTSWSHANGSDLDDLRSRLSSLEAENTQLRRERDAAVNVLKTARDDPDWDPGAMVMLYDQATARAIAAETVLKTARFMIYDDQAGNRADAAEAQLAVWRPIIEAAQAWREMTKGHILHGYERPLVDAIDTLRITELADALETSDTPRDTRE